MVKKKTQLKRRSKKTKFQQMLDRWTPYCIVVLFMYTLYTTQFFYFFSHSQREAHENHLRQESELSLIFNFSTPQDVMDLMMNLQMYFTQIMTNIDLNQMYSYLHDGFGFSGNVQNGDKVITPQPTEYRFVRRENFRFDEEDLTSNPHETPVSDEPLVYIYNSHPTEMIGTIESLAHIEGEMSVIDMSHRMAEEFESFGINSIVETRCLQTEMAERGLGRRWYDASRIFLEETIHQYDSLEFFFDLHRDAIPHNLATVEFEGNSYARVMMVIGKDNPEGHLGNLAMAEAIMNELEDRVPGISRGVRPQGGLGHDGIYNQDLGDTVQLFEIGSYGTTVEEVENTIKVLSGVLAEYIKDGGFD